MFRSFLQIGLVAGLTLGLSGSGCSKKNEYPLSQRLGDSFSSAGREDRLKQLKDDFTASIVIDNQSYENEHNVNRVLRYLAENRDGLKDQLRNVVEIHIGDHFDRREISEGQYAISLDCNSPQQALDLWFQNFANMAQSERTLKKTTARIGLRSIGDLKGMTGGEADNFSKALIEAAKALDFTTPTALEYVSNIQVDRIFAIGERYVIVPFDADADSLRSFLGDCLDLAKHLEEDLKKVSSLLGVSVSFQPGVLAPNEISTGIQALTAASSLFLGTTSHKKPLMIGRRTEQDAARAKAESHLLVAFNASTSDLSAALTLLGTDGEAAAQSLIAAAQALYVQGGITLSVSVRDFGIAGTINDGILARIKDTLSRLENVATTARLNASQIRTVSPTFDRPTVNSGGNGATLLVNFSSFDQATLDSALTTYEASYSGSQRLKIQKGMLDGLRSQYSPVSIDYSDSDLDISTGDKTKALASTLSFFARVATPAVLNRVGIKRVKFAKGSPSVPESVVKEGDTLGVDGYLATEEVLTAVLKQADPGPGPAPAGP